MSSNAITPIPKMNPGESSPINNSSSSVSKVNKSFHKSNTIMRNQSPTDMSMSEVVASATLAGVTGFKGPKARLEPVDLLLERCQP
jgi:hypothetical protein